MNAASPNKPLEREGGTQQDPPKQDFYGRDFLITPDVLIPRPESEMLIDAILNLCGKPYLPGVQASTSKIADNLTILDVGTGSGCLAITLALELPESHISASDISLPALAVARKNSAHFHTDIHFYESDLLSSIDFTPDLIVANLPYVDASWPWLDLAALSTEPSIALYADNGGLALIYKLISQIQKNTKFLVLEADPSQHPAIINYAKTHHLHHYETRGFTLVFQN